ncbi:hypothetical protein PENTCL1PPCAC_6983, partial [Pristionchus entomophagus]
HAFKLGEEFVAKGFDRIDRKMLITVDGDSIVERYQRFDKDFPPEISTYRVEGDYMIQSMVCGHATCKKFFKRK